MILFAKAKSIVAFATQGCLGMDPKATSMVEKVARALCAVDDQDPDEEVDSIEFRPMTGGLTYLRPSVVKGWMTYEAKANRFIAAARVLGLLRDHL